MEKELEKKMAKTMGSLWISKPEFVKVLQYTGDNIEEIRKFVGYDKVLPVYKSVLFSIKTRYETCLIRPGDYVVMGEEWIKTMSEDKFLQTYENFDEWWDKQ